MIFRLGEENRFLLPRIYKFVSRDAWNPRDRAANRSLLDHGTLYVAKFNEDGSGEWLALEFGKNGLDTTNGFRDQADVLIRTRVAGDVVNATKMDRPEWIAVHPGTQEVYCTLTNNARRGAEKVAGIDASNPRANNTFGHIIRWREAGGEPSALKFNWDIFVMAGDPPAPRAPQRHACPDAPACNPFRRRGQLFSAGARAVRGDWR